jgi:acyl-CoA synthetase (NDP forming)
VDQLSRLGIGISSFASVGNKLDVSSNDLLLWWEQDELTKLAAALTPVASEDEAAAVAAAAGGPVVLKADVSGLVHKTDAGAVQLDLRTQADVRAAYRRGLRRGRPRQGDPLPARRPLPAQAQVTRKQDTRLKPPRSYPMAPRADRK